MATVRGVLFPETIASLGLGNIFIIVQLICKPTRRDHQNKQFRSQGKLSSLVISQPM